MTFRARLDAFLNRKIVTQTITAVILFNAVLLGLETIPEAMAVAGPLIIALDTACLAIFVAELAAKMVAQGRRFWRDGWNLFDALIVGVALIPGSGSFSVLRALRILRVLRIVSVFPRLRRVVEGLVTALPGMASVFVLMGIIFYIGSVMATTLFGPSFPEWFGSLPRSGYTLFQVMTLESWSMGIVRPVMEVYPYAWAFFLPFILMTTFAVVNLLVGLIVNSMQDAHSEESNAATDKYRDEVMAKLTAIEARLNARERD